MSDYLNALGQLQLLLQTKSLASLGPDVRVDRESIDSLNEKLEAIFSESKVSTGTQPLIRSLVLLWHDYLDESHSISQNISNIDGSFLHGIMHRREPDYGNAKYWFHRVRQHPCFPRIAKLSTGILCEANAQTLQAKLVNEDQWDSFAFIDACEMALLKMDKPTIALLEEVQKVEFDALLNHFFAPKSSGSA